MPKMKTHSGAKKRFKLTGSGKLRRQQANRRPSLERDRGEPLTVFIRHPIDFRDAVALRLRDDAR